jgi:hypothetical protein
MKSWDKVFKPRIPGATRFRKLQVWIPFAMLGVILCAGVVGFEASKGLKAKPFDPRLRNAPSTVISPMDPAYRGYIPDDAVIPAKDGFYLPDASGGFKKLEKQAP